jgi:putative FmdB family regulatory protein
MPLYEYRCQGCGHRFEILQRLGDGADGLACPRCDDPGLEKQFSTFATATPSDPAAASCGAGDCGAGACCGGGACGMESWN